jgi:hypothetical protein
MFGLGQNYIGLLLPLAVVVLWYWAFGRGRMFSIMALLVLIWMLAWALIATSQRGIF